MFRNNDYTKGKLSGYSYHQNCYRWKAAKNYSKLFFSFVKLKNILRKGFERSMYYNEYIKNVRIKIGQTIVVIFSNQIL